MFLRVDFPAPFSPTMASTRPPLAVKETSERTVTPENDFPIPTRDKADVFSLVSGCARLDDCTGKCEGYNDDPLNASPPGAGVNSKRSQALATRRIMDRYARTITRIGVGSVAFNRDSRHHGFPPRFRCDNTSCKALRVSTNDGGSQDADLMASEVPTFWMPIGLYRASLG